MSFKLRNTNIDAYRNAPRVLEFFWAHGAMEMPILMPGNFDPVCRDSDFVLLLLPFCL